MKKLLISAAVVVAVVAAFILRPAKPIEVRMAKTSQGLVEALVSNTRSGTIKACQRSRLSLALGGQVNHLYVDQGDKVESGTLLLELWNDDLKAALEQSNAQVRMAELNKASACRQAQADQREVKRQRELFNKNLSSPEQLDRTETSAEITRLSCQQNEAQVQNAKANVAVQQARLAQTQLRAPFAGIVAEVNGEVGEYATPSPPGVATPPAIDLIDDRCLYVRAPIDEVDASIIRVGMAARVTLDAFRDQAFTGKVSRIAPYVEDKEKQARTVNVDVTLDALPDDVQLLVGYSADIEVITAANPQTLRIPSEALLEGNHVLTLADDGKTLQKKALTLGLSNWTWTEVSAGLTAEQPILVSLDNPAAVEGAEVTVIDDDKRQADQP
ncbi:efflux RND transporter periplasmic adaptor subunit [Thalassolituus pacificus]|uniref:Efflux RND transporter periplasmic adaptor subunit n=1 Tax=Thalassolituus pacificus TaxID=2975440 RepID=A0A9X3AS71_9GAMM|nr:efflux RND transporter periplasmic adaptor subunit [Thalassolituus pacificus]